jgi:2-amino-4-hydroxy-6-hydroxymethyldihydropteridine diphosphokinase
MEHDLAKPLIRRVAIALGANLGERRATFARAIERLSAELGPILAVSSFIETEALIHPDDPAASYPSYLNAVVVLETALAPLAILDRLQAIERSLGRDRTQEEARWRPRLIDLDLIAADDLVLDTDLLTLPHPEMHRRRFVLEPMREVWPDWRHPRFGLSAGDLLDRLEV